MADASLGISIASLCGTAVSLGIAAAAYRRTGSQWRQSGPDLAFELWVVPYRHPGTNAVHRLVVRMEVCAVGRMATVLRSAELRAAGQDWVRTDITSDGKVTIEPLNSMVSNEVEFRLPDATVRAVLANRAASDSMKSWQDEIWKKPAGLNDVEGRVRRGDGETYTSARKVWCLPPVDEPWPGIGKLAGHDQSR